MPNPDLFRWMSAACFAVFGAFYLHQLRSSLEGLARARRSANELRTSSTLPSANVSGTPDTAGTVVVLQGCVQRAATPDVTGAFRTIVEARGWRVRTVTQEGCCGALPLHLGFDDDARTTARKMVDALVPMLDDVEAIVSSASGCGVTVKDYGRLLADDPDYADAAHSVASKVVDASEFCARYLGASSAWQRVGDRTRVAWHAPCTFQHGQRLGGVVEAILESARISVVPRGGFRHLLRVRRHLFHHSADIVGAAAAAEDPRLNAGIGGGDRNRQRRLPTAPRIRDRDSCCALAAACALMRRGAPHVCLRIQRGPCTALGHIGERRDERRATTR